MRGASARRSRRRRAASAWQRTPRLGGTSAASRLRLTCLILTVTECREGKAPSIVLSGSVGALRVYSSGCRTCQLTSRSVENATTMSVFSSGSPARRAVSAVRQRHKRREGGSPQQSDTCMGTFGSVEIEAVRQGDLVRRGDHSPRLKLDEQERRAQRAHPVRRVFKRVDQLLRDGRRLHPLALVGIGEGSLGNSQLDAVVSPGVGIEVETTAAQGGRVRNVPGAGGSARSVSRWRACKVSCSPLHGQWRFEEI